MRHNAMLWWKWLVKGLDHYANTKELLPPEDLTQLFSALVLFQRHGLDLNKAFEILDEQWLSSIVTRRLCRLKNVPPAWASTTRHCWPIVVHTENGSSIIAWLAVHERKWSLDRLELEPESHAIEHVARVQCETIAQLTQDLDDALMLFEDLQLAEATQSVSVLNFLHDNFDPTSHVVYSVMAGQREIARYLWQPRDTDMFSVVQTARGARTIATENDIISDEFCWSDWATAALFADWQTDDESASAEPLTDSVHHVARPDDRRGECADDRG